MSRCCTRQVFRCFKWLERLGDRITGAAGPVFVALAVILLSVGTVCFFEVVQPALPWPWLTTPVCALIALNLFVHYFYVCTVPPGFADDDEPRPASETGWMWAKKRSAGVRWSVKGEPATVSKCKRCGQLRPEVRLFHLSACSRSRVLRLGCERSHHCRICKRCVLKYDHHCPVRINQCVGIHNERHFVLFLLYLVVATACYVGFGWRFVLVGLGIFDDPWPYFMPPMSFMLSYILAVVLCMAVSAMAGWHLYMVAHGETSVESQDNEQYRRVARDRGESFVNCYDLGYARNLQLFFNVGPEGYSYYTLFLPLRVEPYTHGRWWARRAGFEQHLGVRPGEELTDDDEE
ncbi:zf-DHHC-domain-containing protein [Daedaleopsis nitida]|nr:zf-DHHC-domain-containing protein [Daedaleopsis nitida]